MYRGFVAFRPLRLKSIRVYGSRNKRLVMALLWEMVERCFIAALAI
jgi:hypothetical protein